MEIIDLGCGEQKRIELYDNGNIEIIGYWKNGKLHREGDNPACTRYLNNGEVDYVGYYIRGKEHRDGLYPAYIEYNYDDDDYSYNYYNITKSKDNVVYVEYWHYGEEITKEALERVKKYEILKKVNSLYEK